MSGDRPYRERRALVASAAGLLIVALLLGALVWSTRRTRRRMEGRLALLEQQLAADRRARLALEKALAAERRRIAVLDATRDAATSERLAALRTEAERLRTELDASRERTAEATREIQALEETLSAEKETLAVVTRERTAGERIIRAYQRGVGLVEGAYGFADASGRPFRPKTASEEPGEPWEEAFTGTGFLVSAAGWIVTNRHVVEPWWGEPITATLATQGYSPVLSRLRIFFPGVAEPLPLSVVAVSPEADVGLVRADLRGLSLPVLATDSQPEAAVAGQQVVLLGYPSGLDALLARLDRTAIDALLTTSGLSGDSLAAELARRGLVRPLATQGHLGDVLAAQLVYDAQTTVGGSGGPVFNGQGKVIGVNAAYLADFSGAAFGVPIRFALALVDEAERKARPGPTPRPRRRR